MKLIFFSTDQLGDAILANIILERVVKNIPSVEIYVFNKNHCNTKPLFQQNKNIVDVSTFTTKVVKKNFIASIGNLMRLISSFSTSDTIYITSLLGSSTLAKIIPVVALYARIFYRKKIIVEIIKPYLDQSVKHITLHHVHTFENIFNMKFHIEPSVRFLPNFIGDIPKKQTKTIVILAGASQFAKTLPANKFAEIITYFAKQGFEITLLGSKSKVDQYQANEIMRLISGKVPVVNLVGATNLKEYFAKIASAEYVITNDSSGQHIANVLGVPCGVLWARKCESPIVKAYSWQNEITANIFGKKYYCCKKCSILEKIFIKKTYCKGCIKENYSKMDEKYIISQIEEHLSFLRTLQKIS